MQEIYTENYTTQMKEIKEDSNTRRDILCSWIDGLNSVLVSVFLSLIYKLKKVPIKIPASFFHRY